MKSAAAVVAAIAVMSGCSSGRPPIADPTETASPVKLTREQVLRNREALAMTAAYRRKTGIATETVTPGTPRDRDGLDRMRLERTHPEYGTDAPSIQGVDYVSPSTPEKKK